MKQFTVLHTADWHYKYGRDSQVRPAIEFIVKEVQERRPDAVIIPGDIFENRGTIAPDDAEIIEEAMVAMTKVSQVVVMPGNHDATNHYDRVDTVSGVLSYPDPNLHVAAGYKIIELMLGGMATRVYCLPHPSKYIYLAKNDNVIPSETGAALSSAMRDLMNGIQVDMGDHPDTINILAGHGTITGGISDSEIMLPTGNDLSIDRSWLPKCDAIMYGHLHKAQKVGDAVYCGSIAPLVWLNNPIEPSYNLWKFTEGMEATTEKIRIPVAHQMLKIDIDQNEFSGDDDVNQKILSRIPASITGYNVKLDISIPEDKYSMYNRPMISKHLEENGVNEYKISDRKISAVKTRAGDLGDDITDQSLLKAWCKFDPSRSEYVNELIELDKIIDSKVPKEDTHLLHGYSDDTISLKASNYKPLIGVDIPWDSLGKIICIEGPNAAGKSQLIETERFVNWGILRKDTYLQNVVRKGAKNAFVEREFMSHGRKYKINRSVSITSKGAGSGTLVFQEFVNDKWESRVEGSQGETQKAMNKVIGTYGMYKATRFGSQSDIDYLCTRTRSEMTDVFLEAMAIGGKTLKKDIASDMKEQIETDNETGFKEVARLDAIMSNRENTNDALTIKKESVTDKQAEGIQNDKDLKTLKVDVAIAEKTAEKRPQLQIDLNEKKNEQTRLLNEETKYQNIVNSKDQIQSGVVKINELKTQLDNGMATNQKLIDFKTKYDELTNPKMIEANQLNRDLSSAEITLSTSKQQRTTAITNHDNRVKQLRENATLKMDAGKLVDEVPCAGMDVNDSCQLLEVARNSKLSASELTTQADELESEGCDTVIIDQQIETNEKSVNDIVAKIEASNKYLGVQRTVYESNVAGIERVDVETIRRNISNEEFNNWDTKASELKVSEHALQSTQEQLSGLSGTVLSLEAEIAQIDVQTASLSQNRERVTSLESLVNQSQGDVDLLNRQVGTLEADLKRMDEASEEKDRILKSMEGAIRKITILNTYVAAFSRDGIPYLLLERALPMFEEYANDFLCSDEGFNNAPRVKISAMKENQDGSQKEQVIVTFTDTKGEFPLGESSGFQQNALGYSLRASLAKVYCASTGATISHCMFDEGWGVFDEENLQYGRRMIQKYAEWTGKFIYITHVPSIKEIADTRIIVSPVEGGATVEVV